MHATSRLPSSMRAQVLREQRCGAPLQAFQEERLPLPALAPGEVLVAVIAAGVNPNGVFAALGQPLNVIAGHRENYGVDFHVAGSDAAGRVAAVGPGVSRVRVGDEVVVHGGVWDPACPHVVSGADPALSPSFRAWGYQTPFGSFADFAVAQEHQCLPKPQHLNWAEAGAFLVCAATAYRMLCGWPPHAVGRGDLVLVWGGAGGLGCQAIQIARARGADVVAVVSTPERAAFCKQLGALGCIGRERFTHWGPWPASAHADAQRRWREQAEAFRQELRGLGGGRDPRLVLEHPGEQTLPTSMFVCAPGGMVVTCAGSSGFLGSFDLRTTWVRSKRLQGSHGMNDQDAQAVLELVREGRLAPCVSRVLPFEQVGLAHQWLYENRQPPGNLVVSVGPECPVSPDCLVQPVAR